MTAEITTDQYQRWIGSQYRPEGELNEFWQTDAVARELLDEMSVQGIVDRVDAIVANIESTRRPRARKALGQSEVESAMRVMASRRVHRQLTDQEYFWMMEYALHSIKRELEG